MAIGIQDLRWFSELVWRLHGCTDERAVFAILGAALHRQFRSTVTMAEEFAYDGSSYRVAALLGGWEPPSWYFAAVTDHPFTRPVLLDRSSNTFHLGVDASRSAVACTHFYNLLLRQIRSEDQLLAATELVAHSALIFAVNSDRSYSGDERLLFEQVRLHCAAVVRRLRQASAADFLAGGPTVLRLRPSLKATDMSVPVRILLAHYFPNWRASAPANALPRELHDWIEGSLRRLAREPLPHPLTCFRTEAARGWLLTRLFPDQGGGILLRFTEQQRSPSPFALRACGLAPRECEVLHWTMEGKRDDEIAVILGSSARTVHKHAERVRRKLGVETRGAAAAAARRFLSGGHS